MEKESLIGPQAHERESKLTPEKVQLADGSPLYHVLLENPDAINLSAAEAQAAKRRLSEIISLDRDGVLSCQSKTREEAKSILESIESSRSQQAA